MRSRRLATKKIFFLSSTLLALLSHSALSSIEGNLTESLGMPLGTEETTAVADRIKNIQKDINIISAITHQKKKSPLLEKEVSTDGAIIFKKPNLLYWEVKSPERFIIVVDGKTMWVYHPDLKEAQKYKLSGQYVARQTMEFFLSAIALSLDEIGRQFDIAVYNPNVGFVFEMKPKSRIVAKYLAAVYIWYKEGEGVPHKIEAIGKNGHTTITEFKDVLLNPQVKEGIFRFKLPSGAIITNIENEGMGY